MKTRTLLLVLAADACARPGPHDSATVVAAPTLEAALADAGYRDIVRLLDGELVVLRAGQRLVLASSSCTRLSCATVLDKTGDDSRPVRVDAFGKSDWWLVRAGWTHNTWLFDGSGELGIVVRAGSPPRVACKIELSYQGCNREYGDCWSTEVAIVPENDGATFVTRTVLSGDMYRGRRTLCRRYRLTTDTCTSEPFDCPTASHP